MKTNMLSPWRWIMAWMPQGLVFVAHAQISLTDGLVAHYPFHGSGVDVSGNGRDGTLFNTTETTDRFGQPGHALRFTPNLLSRFEVDGSFIPTGSNPMTVSLWMRIENPVLPPGSFSKYPVFSGTLDNANTWNFHIIFQGNAVDFSPNVERFANNNYLGDYNRWSLFPSYQDALQWHHVTLSFRGDSETALFLDGQRVAWEKPQATPVTERNGGMFAIGWAPGNHSFSGSLDDVRIYNRALSDLEANALYQVTMVPEPQSCAIATTLALVVGAVLRTRRRPNAPPNE